eukprot:scaffold519016_cov18-Prasinocladus_malaysianus.AAC.1
MELIAFCFCGHVILSGNCKASSMTDYFNTHIGIMETTLAPSSWISEGSFGFLRELLVKVLGQSLPAACLAYIIWAVT